MQYAENGGNVGEEEEEVQRSRGETEKRLA